MAKRMDPRSALYFGVENLGFNKVIIVPVLIKVVKVMKKFLAGMTSSHAKTYIENGYIPPAMRKQIPL